VVKLSERVGHWLNVAESRWSLWNLFAGTTLVASFALPAWAAHTAEIFRQYSPLSWVVAGFVGMFLWAITRWFFSAAYRIRINAKYDEQFLANGGNFNPLSTTFERKRIFLNDLVLPSHTLIENKTFVDCDIIGPANIYFLIGNNINPIRPPNFDAVWLHPTAKFTNGFIFAHCIFRNCSFQRLTMFASIENYAAWKDSANISWISIAPSQDDIAERMKVIAPDTIQPPPAKPVETQPAKPVETSGVVRLEAPKHS
jgi:hypothetical protein